jgi:hypothetical protein
MTDVKESLDPLKKWLDEFETLIKPLAPEKQTALRMCVENIRRTVTRNVRCETFADDLGNLPNNEFSMGQ